MYSEIRLLLPLRAEIKGMYHLKEYLVLTGEVLISQDWPLVTLGTVTLSMGLAACLAPSSLSWLLFIPLVGLGGEAWTSSGCSSFPSCLLLRSDLSSTITGIGSTFHHSETSPQQ